MKPVAKWILILWSLFCLFGVIWGLGSVGRHISEYSSEGEKTGATLGAGCGMIMWVGIWAAIALPAFLIYVVAGKKEAVQVKIEPPEHSSRLCKHCGKYYDHTARFCPNCGQSTV